MCSIFCNNLSVTDLYSLVCGHTFHIDCITPWINQGGSCPRCRGVARLADLRRVYIEETANPVQEMTNETNSSNNKINVIVRDVYNDRKICIKDLDPKSTVAQLKHGVEQINGMPIEQQRIVHRGRHLEDAHTLEHHNIVKTDTIVDLVMRAEGGNM